MGQIRRARIVHSGSGLDFDDLCINGKLVEPRHRGYHADHHQVILGLSPNTDSSEISGVELLTLTRPVLSVKNLN